MGSILSNKQSALDAIKEFQDIVFQVSQCKINEKIETTGEGVYKKYVKEYSQRINPLRFYNNYRFFYKIRNIEYTEGQIKEMMNEIDKFNSLSWEYLKEYKKMKGSKLFDELNVN